MSEWERDSVIGTIVLDLDGPLLDGRLRHYTCYSSILKEQGFDPIDIDAYWNGKRARTDRRTLLMASQAVDFYEEFLGEWTRRIELPAMLALDQLQPEVLSILSEWDDAKFRLVIATMRNHADNAMNQLALLGVIPLVDKVLVTGSDDGSGGKAEAVRRVLSDNLPKTALWVGDTEVDIHAARNLNIPICAVTCGLRTHELLAADNPDFLLQDLRDVRGLIGRLTA